MKILSKIEQSRKDRMIIKPIKNRRLGNLSPGG